MMFQKGDAIKITCDGRTVDGTIKLISKNQTAAIIEFEAILGGYAGEMPLLRNDDNTWHDVLSGNVVVEIKPRAQTPRRARMRGPDP